MPVKWFCPLYFELQTPFLPAEFHMFLTQRRRPNWSRPTWHFHILQKLPVFSKFFCSFWISGFLSSSSQIFFTFFTYSPKRFFRFLQKLFLLLLISWCNFFFWIFKWSCDNCFCSFTSLSNFAVSPLLDWKRNSALIHHASINNSVTVCLAPSLWLDCLLVFSCISFWMV